MKRASLNIALGLLLALAWVGPGRAEAGAPTSGVPAWATAVASALLGSNAPSASNPHPQVLTVDELARRVYDSSLATRNFHALGHRAIDPTSGAFLDANGHPTGIYAANPLGNGQSGAMTPLTGCSGVNDANATCHAYAGTAASAYIVSNTCYTNPTGYDGCMGETDQYPQFTYYCGPGSSRVMASNWYGPPMYNLGASPPNSTTKGYAWYENTSPNSGTYTSNMPTPINNDIINHTGLNPGVTSGSSGSQNAFQYRVGYDIYGYGDALITSLYTDAQGYILPEWATYGKNVTHLVTIYGYDFTNYNGAINYFDSASPASGTGVYPGRYGQYVYQFWSNVAANDSQVYIP